MGWPRPFRKRQEVTPRLSWGLRVEAGFRWFTLLGLMLLPLAQFQPYTSGPTGGPGGLTGINLPCLGSAEAPCQPFPDDPSPPICQEDQDSQDVLVVSLDFGPVYPTLPQPLAIAGCRVKIVGTHLLVSGPRAPPSFLFNC
jgi:hypothetical protein